MSTSHNRTVVRTIVGRNLVAFFRGQFLSGLTIAVLATAAFALLGLRWWYVLGPMVGAFGMVPILGTLVGALLAVAAAALQGDAKLVLWTALALVAIQAIDNFIVGPRIHASGFGFRPLASLGIVLFGGILLSPVLGPFGPLFALPIAAIARDALHYSNLRKGPEALSPDEALAVLRRDEHWLEDDEKT
jgi:predicted PurR-regulated permease PerM